MSLTSGKVVIIGGGLAGLATAAELCTRGFSVTVLEKGARPGGKLSAWRDGEGSTVEHGMHGWWSQYFNFFDLMKRVGIPDDVLLQPLPSTVIFEDGTRQDVEPPSSHLPTPLFLARYLRKFKRLRAPDLLSAVGPMARIVSFDHRLDFERFDDISIYALLEKLGGTRLVHDLVFSPFTRSFAFDSTRQLSAAAVLSALSFYFVGHEEDVLTRWCRGNPQELVIEPIVRFIEANGGSVKTNCAVDGFELAAGPTESIRAVRVGVPGLPVRIPFATIPPNAPLVVDTNALGRLLIRRDQGAPGGAKVLAAKCTHLGCEVDYHATDGVYECPCHGGRFDLEGAVLRGPPVAPLVALANHVDGAELVISGAATVTEVEGDYFVLATDVEATKRVLNSTPAILRHDDIRRVLNLTAKEVVTARLWLDKRLPEAMTSGVFTGEGLIDSYFVLSNFQEEFRAYDGAVLEVQLYVVRDVVNLPEAALAAMILLHLGQRIPELQGAVARRWAINRHKDLFTHFTVASHQNRPSTQSSIPNLLFAGDWVRLEEPWWMMEKAVTSGRLAADAVLRATGAEGVTVFRPRPDEPFTKAAKGVSRAFGRLASVVQRVFGYTSLGP